ncbi:MAG: histidine kinase N-terminal 7TM domain-containing protein, partial [Candidatus Omnitrophota bacterium]
MNFFKISCLIVSVCSFSLGLLVYVRGTKLFINKILCLLCLSISLWSFGLFKVVSSSTREISYFWIKPHYFGAIFIPVFFLHFVSTLLDLKNKLKKILWSGYILVFINLLLIIFTPWIVKDVTSKFGFKFYTEAGIFYNGFTAYFILYIAIAYYLLFEAFKKATGYLRNKIKYVLIASVIGFPSGSAAFFPVY